MYTFNDTKFSWQKRWMCLWQKANKFGLDCHELGSWWKRWLGWTRANLLRLDHVGFFLEKAVSGWNAQETCHPVLSRFSSQCSAHFLLWYLSKAFSSDTGQCLSSMLVSKHGRFFSRETKRSEKYINGSCCFFHLYAASIRRIPCTIHERPSGHPKADLINELKLNRILMFHPQYKLNLSIEPDINHAFHSWFTFYYNGDLTFPQALCVTGIVLYKWQWLI